MIKVDSGEIPVAMENLDPTQNLEPEQNLEVTQNLEPTQTLEEGEDE